MSDAVNAAIIGAGATVLAAVIGIVWKNKKHPKQQPNKQGTLSHVGYIANSTININSPQAVSPKIETSTEPKPQFKIQSLADVFLGELKKHGVMDQAKPITDLTHKQIVDAIEAATPFHQTKIKENFIGKRVAWKSSLQSISHEENETLISASLPLGRGTLVCSSRPENCDVFLVAQTGTNFIVTGEIDEIEKNYACLINCTFKLIQADVR